MDFNTGSGGAGVGRFLRRTWARPRVSGGATGRSFDYRDPVQSFISTVRGVVLRPVDFFRGILRQGDFLNPLIFALICYEVAAILGVRLADLSGDGQRIAGAFGGFSVPSSSPRSSRR